MSRIQPRTWFRVKGKIISAFGTVSACASEIGCSEDGLRKAVDGKCPGIAARLKIAIQYDWEAGEAVAA
jgi:hypothetical protein